MNRSRTKRQQMLILACGVIWWVITTCLCQEMKGQGSELAAAAKEVLRTNCAECHTGKNAIAGVQILNHQALLDDGHVEPGEPDNSYLYELITSTGGDAMPPKNRPALTESQIDTIRKWIVAGAKPFPADIESRQNAPGDSSTESNDDDNPRQNSEEVESPASAESDEKEIHALMLEHVRKTEKQDRPFLRFFSLRHLLEHGVTAERMEVHRNALAKAINHLSKERELVTPTPIDESKSVLVVDIRMLGWHRKVLTNLADETDKLNLFDLVLLEYPYAVLPTDSDAFDDLQAEFLNVAGQVRPIPYVRADWFCSTATLPPLYHDLLQLPLKLEELENELGVDVDSNLESGSAFRAGMAISGVSRNNRVVERHPHRDGYYWKSHDFQSNVGAENIVQNPIDFFPSGGEMIFALPNGMQGYYVSDARGDRLDVAPTSIVVDKFASDRKVRNGLGCIRCHRAGTKDFSDSISSILKSLPAKPGFNKRRAIQLYPGNEFWDKQISKDQRQFAKALETIGQSVDQREPLTVVTSDYLEGALSVSEAAAEIGVAADDLKTICRTPGSTRLGLAPFASQGVIRRDAWEHNFDAAVNLLGVGIPIVPVNGNMRLNFVPDALLDKIELTSNKRNNLFEPGDRFRVTVNNKTGGDVFIELYGTSIDFKKVQLTSGITKISAGGQFAFPQDEDEFIEIRGGLGREEVTLYASAIPFAPGKIFRGQNMADRVVHSFIESDENGEISIVDVLKKTILIETR